MFCFHILHFFWLFKHLNHLNWSISLFYRLLHCKESSNCFTFPVQMYCYIGYIRQRDHQTFILNWLNIFISSHCTTRDNTKTSIFAPGESVREDPKKWMMPKALPHSFWITTSPDKTLHPPADWINAILNPLQMHQTIQSPITTSTTVFGQ